MNASNIYYYAFRAAGYAFLEPNHAIKTSKTSFALSRAGAVRPRERAIGRTIPCYGSDSSRLGPTLIILRPTPMKATFQGRSPPALGIMDRYFPYAVVACLFKVL